MQLKRDTDYAVRILYCLNQNYATDNSGEKKGVTLSEISMQTGTPKLVAGRVCDSLKEKGIIFSISEQDTAEKAFYSNETLLSFSLLDVIEAVEGTCQLFVVFDKRFAGYRTYEDHIKKIQKRTERILAKATLSSLFETQDNS